MWSDCLLDLSFWPLSNVDFRQTRPLITRKTAASLFLFCFLIPFLSIGPMIVLCFGSLYNGQEVFVWSDCLLELGTDFLVGNMVFVGNA